MPSQVFTRPDYYDREIELSQTATGPSGVPAGVIGVSSKGPAFIPTTLGNFSDFVTQFGDLNVKYMAPYAVNQFLNNRFSATFIRILGAGANQTITDISVTQTQGTVKNAGWLHAPLATNSAVDGRQAGAVQFLAAKHVVNANEAFGISMFSDNNSFTLGGGSNVYLVRAMILTANDTRVMVLNGSGESWTTSVDDICNVDATTTDPTLGMFKLVLSSSQGTAFGNSDGVPGLKIFSASLDPDNQNYIAKILNTDPEKFSTARHFLYADFPVDAEMAMVLSGTAAANSSSVGVFSGSSNTSTTSGNPALAFLNGFGSFNTRFTTPISPTFISQPFGGTEYDLFQVQALSDGATENSQVKISIANIQGSTDPRYQYGTFTVLVRDFTDNDLEPIVLEQFNNVNLDPDSSNYIGQVIGDKRFFFNFDAVSPDDKRIIKTGQYPNASKYINVVVTDAVKKKRIPASALPFGFRGIPALKTNDTLTDSASGNARFAGSGSADPRLLGAIVPPLPFRFKATRNPVSASSVYQGYPGPSEVVDPRFYFGVKFERNLDPLNSNIYVDPNNLVSSLTQFLGIPLLDMVVTGSGADLFNNNKFTLARVALGNQNLSDVTASADVHMREAAYIRNGVVNPSTYTVQDGDAVTRQTLASLIHSGTVPILFNKFAQYMKFSTIVQGGFDGVNILDKNAARLGDKGTSTETNGGANGSFLSPGFASNQAGAGSLNNAIVSYQKAIDIMTNPMLSNINVMAIPGIREPIVADYAAVAIQNYEMALYIMDIPYYDYNQNRIFDEDATVSGSSISVINTANLFDGRGYDNNYIATYFPNFFINDTVNNRRLVVPASIAALAAIGFNDRLSYPWFAPAGFNRASLDFVTLTQVRINQPDRDLLYKTRINPIVKFPGQSYVIFSQQTLQQAKTALSSINVRRMLLEVKRIIVQVGNSILFDQNTPALQAKFVNAVTPLLANIQTKQGISMFKVTCDSSNNSSADVDQNKMNGSIRLVPVLAVEFIAMDFIITPSGVSFGN